MSEIIKTEAIVLSKTDFSDSSKIVNLFTKEYGRMSAIIKGGRNKNSKIGMIVDPLNVINLVIYRKPNRELQLISSADLIDHHRMLREDFERLKFGFAVIELINEYSMQEETNKILFVGCKRILELLNSSNEHPLNMFLRFFLFFLKEIGYDINLEKCPSCNSEHRGRSEYGFLRSKGIICSNCMKIEGGVELSLELFELYRCLKLKKSVEFNESLSNKLLNHLLGFLEYHSIGFRGIKSLKL